MVLLTNLANPISQNIVYKYKELDAVKYNDICYIVLRLLPELKYELKNSQTMEIINNISETDLSNCTTNELFQYIWNNFIYTGDNKNASNFIITNMLSMMSCEKIEFGPNNENNKYYFKYQYNNNIQTLEKNKT